MSRTWRLHAIVVLVVLGASLAYLASIALDFAMAFSFLWLPVAVVYAASSTALVALVQPGRAGVAVIHAIALLLAALAPQFFVTIH